MLNDLFDKQNKAEFGGAIKPIGETFKLASAAAAVTLLIEGGAKRDNALKQVCDKTGLDRRKLSNYRDNLIRRRVHWIALASYDLRLKHGRRSGEPGALMDAWSKAEELLLKAPR